MCKWFKAKRIDFYFNEQTKTFITNILLYVEALTNSCTFFKHKVSTDYDLLTLGLISNIK